MLRALWVVPRLPTDGGVFVREFAGDDPVVPMTPYEARRLAAELVAAADQVEPPPPGGGRAPYGWRYVRPNRLEPDPVEACVVDRIVNHVLDGYTRPQSVAALNALGLQTRYGKAWTRDALRQIQVALQKQGILRETNARPYRRRTEQPEGDTLL